jgi:hypothetical protein
MRWRVHKRWGRDAFEFFDPTWSSYRCLYHHCELPVNRCCRLPGWSSRTAAPFGNLALGSHHAQAPSGQRSHPIRLWVVRTDGRRVTGPCRPRCSRPTRRPPWGATPLWSIPATAGEPRHDAGDSPSRLPTRWDSSLGGQPGEQGGVGNAGLAPEVHDRELARTQEPGKDVWAHAQPPLRFFERNQLRRHGDLQGEILLPRGRAWSGAWASGHQWHGRGGPCQEPGRQHGEQCAPQTQTGCGRCGGDSAKNLC